MPQTADWAALLSITASLFGQPEGPKGTFQDTFAESISQGKLPKWSRETQQQSPHKNYSGETVPGSTCVLPRTGTEVLRSRCQGVPSNLFDLEEAIILQALRFLSLRLMVATTLPLSDSNKRLELGVSKYGAGDVKDGHDVYTWPSAHRHLSLHSRFSWKHCTKGTWTPTLSIFMM